MELVTLIKNLRPLVPSVDWRRASKNHPLARPEAMPKMLRQIEITRNKRKTANDFGSSGIGKSGTFWKREERKKSERRERRERSERRERRERRREEYWIVRNKTKRDETKQDKMRQELRP
jgi:hypothetical protein